MKKIFIIPFLFLSCVDENDSILNYKGGIIVSTFSAYWAKIRIQDTVTNKYVIKTISVYDRDLFDVGDTIK